MNLIWVLGLLWPVVASTPANISQQASSANHSAKQVPQAEQRAHGDDPHTVVTGYWLIANNTKHGPEFYTASIQKQFAAWGERGQKVVFFFGEESHGDAAQKAYLAAGGRADSLRTVHRRFDQLGYENAALTVGDHCDLPLDWEGRKMEPGIFKRYERICFNKVALVNEAVGMLPNRYYLWADIGIQYGNYKDRMTNQFIDTMESGTLEGHESVWVANYFPDMLAWPLFGAAGLVLPTVARVANSTYLPDLGMNAARRMHLHDDPRCSMNSDYMSTHLLACVFACDAGGCKRFADAFDGALSERVQAARNGSSCTCFDEEEVMKMVQDRVAWMHTLTSGGKHFALGQASRAANSVSSSASSLLDAATSAAKSAWRATGSHVHVSFANLDGVDTRHDADSTATHSDGVLQPPRAPESVDIFGENLMLQQV